MRGNTLIKIKIILTLISKELYFQFCLLLLEMQSALFSPIGSRVGYQAHRCKLFSAGCLSCKRRTWQENKRIFSLLCNPQSPSASTEHSPVWSSSSIWKHQGQMYVKTGASQKSLPNEKQKIYSAFSTTMFLKDLIKAKEIMPLFVTKMYQEGTESKQVLPNLDALS